MPLTDLRYNKVKITLNFILWFELVSEDEQSYFKPLKMLSEPICSDSFSNNFS